MIIILDRFFNQPLGDYNIDSLIGRQLDIESWESIKRHYFQTKKLQSEELCKQLAPETDDLIFDEEEVVVRFDPKLQNGTSFSGLFYPNNKPELQLSFLPEDSGIVMEHAIGMAESILCCLEEEVIVDTIPSPKINVIHPLKSPSSSELTAMKFEEVTQKADWPANRTVEEEIQTDPLKTEETEEVLWYPQEQPPSSLEIMFFLKNKLARMIGQIWNRFWQWLLVHTPIIFLLDAGEIAFWLHRASKHDPEVRSLRRNGRHHSGSRLLSNGNYQDKDHGIKHQREPTG